MKKNLNLSVKNFEKKKIHVDIEYESRLIFSQ